MYAVVETGGKQVRLEQGDSVKVERLDGEIGEAIELDDVRLIVDGENVVADKGSLDASKVKAVIRSHGRGDFVTYGRSRARPGAAARGAGTPAAASVPAAGGSRAGVYVDIDYAS